MAIQHFHESVVESLASDQPITMLNLMRFRESSLDRNGSGWDAYVRYSKMANKLIKERGGSIFWAGEIAGTPFGPAEAGNWDYAALVFYPSPDAFSDMMTSAAYAEANVHRENGCEDHLIMAVNETRSIRQP